MAGRTKVRTQVNDAEIRRLAFTNQYVRALEEGAANRIQENARLRAPMSKHGSHGRPPGYLRKLIIKRKKRGAEGYSVIIMSVARTPEGFPYGLIQQQKRPYIRPLGK